MDKKKTSYELIFKKKFNVKVLRTFGELASIKRVTSVQSKIKDKGEMAMILGYDNNYPYGTYRFMKIHNYEV